MNVRMYLTLGLVALAGFTVKAANADSYSETTTIEQAPAEPMIETREVIRTEETAPTTTVIREQPTTIIKEEPVKETVVVKKKDHHLIKVGPVKVF